MRPFTLPLDPHFSTFFMKISKTSSQLHFGLTKKDPGLVLHFDVLDLFKSWSKLGLTRIQMSKTNSKKIKKWKKHVLIQTSSNRFNHHVKHSSNIIRQKYNIIHNVS